MHEDGNNTVNSVITDRIFLYVCVCIYIYTYIFNCNCEIALIKAYNNYCYSKRRGYAVVEALRYKLECRGFDSRWGHWDCSLT
jgi:hypothetical protein